MNEVLSDWPTLTDTTSHTHARTSNTRPTYTAAPSILLAIVLFWCWSIYITQSRSCDAWRWLAVYGGRQQLTFIKHLTSGPFISISQILLIFATRKRENIGCNFNYLPGFPWYFLIDWFCKSTAYADLEGSWNLQSLISPILLEMKKLVIFHICVLPQLYVKVGPPLEKFSGSAPVQYYIISTTSWVFGSRSYTRIRVIIVLGPLRLLCDKETKWVGSSDETIKSSVPFACFCNKETKWGSSSDETIKSSVPFACCVIRRLNESVPRTRP